MLENRITEQSSEYDNLQQMSTHDILVGINREDARVHEAVRKVIPAIPCADSEICTWIPRSRHSSASARPEKRWACSRPVRKDISTYSFVFPSGIRWNSKSRCSSITAKTES